MPSGEGRDRGERPEYKVYRSRPGILRRLDPSALRERLRPSSKKEGRRRPSGPGSGRKRGGARSGRRRWLRIALIVLGGWLLLSVLAFAVSSQLQKAKLSDEVDVGAIPLMPVVPQNILVLGTDIRSGQFAGPTEAASRFCLSKAAAGEPPPSRCEPYRSDTIMLIRAGGGAFRKLSIPRDTLAEIPGHSAQKINAAYALGGADLTVRTVESFLGLEVDQVAIVDFDGFRRFIDAIGGVEVDLPTAVCSSVSGGAFQLDLSAGEHTLDGYAAITLARTRYNSCGSGELSGTDLERNQFQQLILDGIKGRLTSITRLPNNFLKGPIIGWAAPKAVVSSMGAITMPELALAAAIGGGGTDLLRPSALTDPLVIPQSECERAARRLLGSAPPRTPACSPGG